MTIRFSTARGARRVVVVGVGAVMLLGACTSDGTGPLDEVDVTLPADGGEAVPEPEPAPEPEPEPAPEPEPEPGGPPAESPDLEVDDGEFTTEEWFALILLGLGGLALIIGAMALASRHSDKKQAQQNASRRRSGEIVGLTRWLVDQGSMDVMRATDAHQLDMAWNSVRTRAIDIENRCQMLASSADQTTTSNMFTTLGLNVAGLRGALETSVRLREDQNATQMQSLIDDGAQTIYRRRQDVQMAMDALSREMG